MTWTKEVLKDVQYATSHNLEARIAIHKYGVNPLNFWNWVWEHYNFCEGDRVLEVGCGTGLFWKEHYKQLPAQPQLILIDFSQSMIGKSRETLHPFLIHFAVADVESLSFHDRTFDHVVCHFMLYHASSQDAALREMIRVLKQRGSVGCLTVSKSHMKRLWDVGNEIDSNFRYESRMSHPFCEENAEDILTRYFATIEKDVYKDTLQIDNSDVVIEYLHSVLDSAKEPPGKDFYQRYARYIKQEIVERGYFAVGKQSVFYKCGL